MHLVLKAETLAAVSMITCQEQILVCTKTMKAELYYVQRVVDVALWKGVSEYIQSILFS